MPTVINLETGELEETEAFPLTPQPQPQQLQQSQSQIIDLDTGELRSVETIPGMVQQKQIPEGNAFDAVYEPAKAMLSNMAGTVIGGNIGLGQTMLEDANAGAETIKEVQAKFNEFGQPQTQRGQEALNTVGDLMEKGLDIARFPVSGIGGLLELISGQGVDQAAKTIKDIQEKGIGQTFGDRVFDETGDPLLSTAAGISPELAASVIPLRGMIKKRMNFRNAMAEKIKSGSTDAEVAKYIVKGAKTLKADDLAKKAIRQGYDQSVIAAIKGASQTDKAQMKKMLANLKRGKENALFAQQHRPTDIPGKSLTERVNYIKKVNTDAGKKLDVVARDLKGKYADFQAANEALIDDLYNIGVQIDDTFKPHFAGSSIEGLQGPITAVKQLLQRMPKVQADAFSMHLMKKYIDEMVTYGKSGEGLKGKVSNIMKKYRRNIDSVLDENFPAYDKVNTTYQDTVNALDTLQDAAGGKINFFAESSDKAAGTLMRRLMSNYASRANLVDAVNEVEKITRKYGGKFNDDLYTQMLFADELDSVFGPVARSSLASEVAKGTRKTAETMIGARSKTDTAFGLLEQGANKLMGINQENAFKVMEELLNRP